MELNVQGLKDKTAWEEAGVTLPSYDYETVWKNTLENPVWIHFGAGNIFRGYIANLQQSLLNQGLANQGIIAADTFDYDIIDDIYKPHDNLTLLVGLRPDGKMDKEIIASIAKGLKADASDADQMKQLTDIFENEKTQMASFTITEKGYALTDLKGNYFPVVEADIKNGPAQAKHAMSMVTALMLKRFQKNAAPIALVSMDNCSHNGEKLQHAVFTIAEEWKNAGFVGDDFIAYLQDETKVSFPWSMIDKITPRPDKTVEASLIESGIKGIEPIVTSKNTFIAPFVNAEIPQYLVVEDKFPNGRPVLEKAGVFFTTRDTVNKTERMKVTTCLNPLHTALAVYGCVLGYHKIADEMKDDDLKALIEMIGYKEGMPVVTDPGILNPMDFIKEVIDKRLPNPFIPDMPQRIATDTSQKIAIRFGETIKSYEASDSLNTADLTAIPLAIAGWLRYLLAVDDSGETMELSNDPMLSVLQKQLEGIQLGDVSTVQGKLSAILKNEVIFGLDLTKTPVAAKVESMFKELIAGPGAVRETLHKYVA